MPVRELPAVEMARAGRRGDVFSHKNRCLFRMILSESDLLLGTSLGGWARSREGDMGERKK